MTDTAPGCVFCDIAAGTAPAHHVFEDDLSFAILDINPFTQGHCLVLPKRHVPWWHQLTEAETASLFNVAHIVANRMMQVFEPDFVMLYARGRRIPHTHIFLVPTYSGDLLDKYFNTLETIQESPVELAQLRAKPSMAEAARRLRESETGLNITREQEFTEERPVIGHNTIPQLGEPDQQGPGKGSN